MLKRYIVLLMSTLSVAGIGCTGKARLPTGDTSTLSGTLLLIQEILNRSGKMEFVNRMNNRTADVVFEITRAQADVGRCGVGYHAKSTINGMVLFDRDGKIVFRQTEGLNLMTAQDYFKTTGPTANPNVTPPTYILAVEQDAAGRQAGQGDAFVFTDKAWAEALKDAMSHAVAFCTARK